MPILVAFSFVPRIHFVVAFVFLAVLAILQTAS